MTQLAPGMPPLPPRLQITQTEHMRLHGRGGDWGQADKTHCPAGHPYDEDNTAIIRGRSGLERRCRTCLRMNSRRYYEANIETERLKARKRWRRLKLAKMTRRKLDGETRQ